MQGVQGSLGVMSGPNTPAGSQPMGPQGMSPFDPNNGVALPPFDLSGVLDELSMLGFDFSQPQQMDPGEDEPDPWASPMPGASPTRPGPMGWGARGAGGVPEMGPYGPLLGGQGLTAGAAAGNPMLGEILRMLLGRVR